MQRLGTPIVETEDHALSASLGDLDALGELYERFSAPLLRYLTMRTQNNLTVAEDVAQTTWLRVAQAIPRYRTRGNGFEAWLFTIARRALAEHYRTFSRRKEYLDGEMLAYEHPDGDAGPADLAQRKYIAHQLAAEVQALNPSQKMCVIYRFWVGLSLEETAAVMGKSVNAIKQLQFRALRALGERLNDEVATDMGQPPVKPQRNGRSKNNSTLPTPHPSHREGSL